MRVTLRADSMDADEAHTFVAAFQRTTRRHDLPANLTKEPTVTICGPTSFNITTPALTTAHAQDLMDTYINLRAERAMHRALRPVS